MQCKKELIYREINRYAGRDKDILVIKTFTVMGNAIPKNEPVLDYEPGSMWREALKKRINELKSQRIEIPLIIGER